LSGSYFCCGTDGVVGERDRRPRVDERRPLDDPVLLRADELLALVEEYELVERVLDARPLLVGSLEMRLQPLLQLMPRHRAGGDAFEKGDGLVLLLGRVNPPAVAVALHELEEAQEAGALVPVRHRVIADQVPCEHGGLLYELGVRLNVAVAGGGSGES